MSRTGLLPYVDRRLDRKHRNRAQIREAKGRRPLPQGLAASMKISQRGHGPLDALEARLKALDVKTCEP